MLWRIGHASYVKKGIRKETSTWYAFKGRERIGGFPTKLEAEEAAQLAWGDPTNTRSQKTLKKLRAKNAHLDTIITEYVQQRQGKHARVTEYQLRNIFSAVGWTMVKHLNVEDAKKWLEGLDRAAQTKRNLGRLLCSFSRYLVDQRYLDPTEDPFRTPSGRSLLTFRVSEADRTFQRTGITPEQFTKLYEATEASGVSFAFAGPARAALYLVAVCTGWRRRSLASLRPRDFELDGVNPHVSHPASQNKSKKADVKVLPAFAVERLREFLAGKPEDERLWPLNDHSAKMLRADLEAVGIPWRVEDKVVDFHSLRGTYNTWLQQAGVSLEERQRLMQHSTPLLTARTYTFVPTSSAETSAALLGERLEQAGTSHVQDGQGATRPPNSSGSRTERRSVS